MDRLFFSDTLRRLYKGDCRRMASYSLAEMCELQGLPAGFDLPGLTMQYKYEVIGNGVPLSMGRQIAHAVATATLYREEKQ